MSVLQSNLLKILLSLQYICHITPLYKTSETLKFNDNYQLEVQNSCTNFTTVNCRKYAKIFFQRIRLVILIKPDLLVWKITLFSLFQAILERNDFLIRDLSSKLTWNDV